MKRLAILGSTGSIGTQALEVVSSHPDLFQVEVLSAHGNTDLLIAQALKYKPNAVVVTNEDKYEIVKKALESSHTKVFVGQAKKEGMMTMIDDGIFKAVQGITTIEEILRVVSE